MKTAEALPQAPTIPRRRKLRPALIALAVALVVTASVFAGALAVYNPLTEGSVSGTSVTPGAIEDTDDPAAGTSLRSLTYVHDGELVVELSIANDGPWGVTITDIDVDRIRMGLFEVNEVRRGVLDRCCVNFETFAPFALHPGEERMLQLRGVMNGCGIYTPGSDAGWNSYRVTYEILGVARTRDIPLTRPVQIRLPDKYVCPEGSPGA